MSFADLITGVTTVTASIVDPNGGTTTRDPVTLKIITTPATPVSVNSVFTQLSSSELAARQQLQDNSKYKLIIEDTTINRTFNHTYEVTINGTTYNITGEPKKPVLPIGWLTIYLSAK